MSDQPTIDQEIERWRLLCNGNLEPDDPDAWDFYDNDIMRLAKAIQDDIEREKALSNVRELLNLHTRPTYFCERCKDEGWVYWTSEEGYDMAAKCPVCHGVPNPKILYEQANIPSLFRRYKPFRTYDEPALNEVKEKVWRFVTNYEPGKGLLLMGPVGVGKTHLAVSIIKLLTERKVRCRFWDINEWLDRLRHSYDGREDTEALLEEPKSVELLVFDDLGAQRITDHTTDRLFDVINARYLRRLSTIITTNISERQIRNTYGDRVWSRLTAMCKIIIIDTIDHRQRKETNDVRRD